MATQESAPIAPLSFEEFAQVFETRTFHDKFMLLNIFVDCQDEELQQKYRDAALAHNIKLVQDPQYIDAGFDLFLPCGKMLDVSPTTTHFLDFSVRCSAQMIYLGRKNINCTSPSAVASFRTRYNTGYYLYPRSSISKTPLRLANNVGIIDSGYRGHIIGAFDSKNDIATTIPQYTRLVQICSPHLSPIFVNIVSSEDELGKKTARGDGGFGSTGK